VRKLGRDLMGAISFLTIFPVPRSAVTANILVFFPILGLAIGELIRLVAKASLPSGQLAAGVICAGAYAFITRGFHLDAIIDSFDGLLGFTSRERRLSIMDEPTVGAFGVIAGIFTILIQVVFLPAFSLPLLAIPFLFAASRAVMAALVAFAPPAKADGLFAMICKEVAPGAKAAIIAQLVISLAAVFVFAGPAAFLAGILGSVAALALTLRRIQGMTGDTAGFIGIAFELAALIAGAHGLL
jgi:adenosylcobinamide-GDP ribazoletransferase